MIDLILGCYFHFFLYGESFCFAIYYYICGLKGCFFIYSPNDWCYIYNFENPNMPVAVSLPAGQGKLFQETMDNFIKDIRKDIFEKCSKNA